MVNVEARTRIKGKEFCILVDVDKALQYRKGQSTIDNVLIVSEIFYDIKKGLKASNNDLMQNFGTSDVKIVADKIIKNGDIQLPSEYKKKEQEGKLKQIIDFLVRNAVDPTTGNPHTAKRIEMALEEIGIKIENKPIDEQIPLILSKLKEKLPIKIETKKLKIIVPAVHTGKAYGLLKENKEKEEWLNNGDLLCVINIPAGMQMEFYDKLNAITHGSSLVEEIKQ